ncbi:spermatogenesis-associated protein 31E1-like [Kogia breviceps]|uniref:spermatogenesis-associated protein 31E1-like n=1 Tax=Kogia breviceps TaxID=27615 RepID=UPI0034D18598
MQMMENPLFSLKSTFDTWLNTSSTFWAIDTIFAFLCALGLFFLLLPYLQNNPSSPPPRKHGNIRKHQMEPRGRCKLKKKNKALKACGACREELEEVRALLSLLQSHLERLLDKGSFHQPSCQDPPGEACKAASAGADQPCREPAEEAVPATCPSAALAPLTQGSLPVASTLSTEPQDQSNLKRITLGTAAKSSTPGNSFWATVILAILSVGLAFYCVLFLSLWWKTTKALFFPTSSQSEPPQEHLAHQPPEAPFLAGPTDKQVETGSLSFVNPEVQKLLEILITKNAKLKICKGKEKDGSFSEQMSSDYLSNIQKQHLQKRLIKGKTKRSLSLRIHLPLSLELSSSQCQFLRTYQAQGKQGPWKPSAFTGKRRLNPQKIRSRFLRRSHRKGQMQFQPGKDFGKVLRPCPRRLSKAFSRASLPVKFLQRNSEKESERYLMRSLKSDSGHCLPSSPERKALEKFLKAHLSTKLRQINQGLIPVIVRQSRLLANCAFSKPPPHEEIRNLAPLKCWKPCVNSSRELSFPSPSTGQIRETRHIRWRGRHRWDLPNQASEPINLKPCAAQPLSSPRSSFSPSATCQSGAHSKANFAKFLGKPQPRQGMKVVTKATGPTLVSPLPVPSPEHTEIQRARGKASPGDMSGPSEAPLTGQEDRLPYQMSTVNLMGRSWENGTVLGFPATRKTLSPPTKSVAQHPKEPRLKTQVAQGCATGELLQDSHTDILLQDDAIGMPLQDSATNVLLQGSHTDVLLADMLASRRSLSSSQREHASEDAPAFRVAPRDLNVSEQSSQGQQKFRKPKLKDSFKSEGEMLAPAEEWRCVRRLQPGEHEETRSNQGQQEPRKPTVRDPRKGQFASTDGRRDDRRPKPGEYEERSSGWQASQASGMSHASQVRERGESLGSKHPQPSPGKRRLLPEKQNWLGYVLRLLSPKRKDKGIEESLQKGKPASSTAQHQKPIRGKSVVESRAVDPWAIGRAVGQVPVKKMGLRQGLCASDLNQHPKQFQAPAEGHSHYHRLLSSSEKRRVLKDTAYSHQASPQDHSYHNKSRHTRGRGDKLASPPRGLESPVRPCQHRPRVAGDSGQLHHHPTCPQKCVPSGQRKCASHAFPGRKVVHEKAEFMQRKPASSHVNTLSMC